MKHTFAETADHIDVEYVARLARLRLTEEERAAYQKQLDDILDYVRVLNEADVEGVEPMVQPFTRHNVLRNDEPRPGLDRERVMENAPRARNNQFLMPLIVE